MSARALCSLLVATLAAAFAPAQDSVTQPATRAAPSTVQRLNEQIALLEDARNPAETRRTIARNLLLDNWPETPPRLAAVLAGSNAGAKAAVAAALAEFPQLLDAAYVDPLIALLADPDAELRQAAGTALAAARDAAVIPRLRERALDREQPTAARLGAIGALGQMIDRAAVDALAEALRDPDPAIAAAALGGLQRAAAVDVADPEAALAWWESTRGLSDEGWHRQQVERLVRRDRETQARLAAVEGRLVKVLEANFQRATDSERASLIAEFLADPSSNLRMLGLALIQEHLGDGKPVDSLPRELVARVRDLLNSRTPAEQAAAVRTVTGFRKSEDAKLFLELLTTTRQHDVRLAVINGLGYLGDDACVQALLDALPAADYDTATEVYASLGRLAERGALGEASKALVIEALSKAFVRSAGGPVTMRERVLWAMGNVADPSFAASFAAALDRNESIAVRQQAIRGVAILKDPKLADALAAATTDLDVVVRQTAVESLATLASSDRHLQALMGRVASPPETDESIRQAAWRGALSLLVTRPPEEVDEWLGRLPGDDRQRATRTVELLQRLLRGSESERPAGGPRVGILRARLASALAVLGQDSEALSTYLRALAELDSADVATRVRIGSECLRLALARGLYDEAVASALSRIPLDTDPDAFWRVIRAELEARLSNGDAGLASPIIDAIRAIPPGILTPEAKDGLDALAGRAARTSTTRPATQPGAAQPADSAGRKQ